MAPAPSDYAERIAKLHTELGVPDEYAKLRGLVLQPEAEKLVSIGKNDAGRDCLLTPECARAWDAMRDQARMSDVELIPLSGFRSVDRQAEIVRGKLAVGEAITQILRSIAAPGFSEHHTGCAVDVGAVGVLPLEEAFAATAAFAWLVRHGATFGFRMSYPISNSHGFIYEPWHWFWTGGPGRE